MLSADDLITTAVEDYSDTVYRIAFNITQNTHDAYDVVQEVFLRLIKNREKIKNKEHLKAWLIRTAVNCSKTSAKKARKNAALSLDEINEPIIEDNKDGDSLTGYILRLPEKYRTALYLFYYEDLPIAKISEYLSISESAVKTRLHRGRELLEKKLKGDYEYVW